MSCEIIIMGGIAYLITIVPLIFYWNNQEGGKCVCKSKSTKVNQ